MPLLSSLACVLSCTGIAEVVAPPASVPGASPLAQVVAFEYSPAIILQKLQALAAPAAAETLAAIARLSVHASAEVRLAAVQALARLGNAEIAARPLIAALADVDHQVQREALRALGVLKIKAARPQLASIARMTRRDDLRQEAESALAAISAE
ncbi:MAG: HEAT repeat domain-containing protein [Chthoniobacteraceae bacterium]